MADLTRSDLVFGIIDIGVVIVLAALLLLAYFRGFLKSRLLPWYGLVIVAGLFLAVFAHVWEISYSVLRNVASDDAYVFGSPYFSVERLHYLISLAGFTLIAVGVSVALASRKQSEAEILDTRRELEVAKYFEYQAEERFRYLFSSTADSVYCYRFDPPMLIDLPVAEQLRRSYDAVLQDCNVVFARELGAEDPSEVIGSRMGRLDSSQDVIAHEVYFKTFIAGDYHLNGYDQEYTAPDGQRRSLHINMVGIVRDGLLHRMWAVESNTTQLRETKQALENRQQFQELVAMISSRLVMAPGDEVDEILEGSMKDVCEFVDADQSTLFWLNQEDKMATVAYVWSPEGNPFPNVPKDLLPLYGSQLNALKSVRIDDIESLPPMYSKGEAKLQEWGVKSLLALPLIVGGQAVGGISFVRLRQAGSWSDQVEDDLRVFAELFANFALRVKSRRALDLALSQLERATERLQAENVYLRQEIELTHGFDEIVCRSDAMLRCLRLVEQVAPTRTPVLIIGETGTGKELIARAVHELSERSERPLVKVNCAALPANLVESELFGYEKGAFTSADSAKRGRFDLANDGTLFLDEIGEIPVELQAKLLRVLQEGEFERLGGNNTIKVDVRLIVATNRNLADAVLDGGFRSDLYYRINTFPIELPPLRDRGGDIQLLAEHFVRMHAPRLGREVTELSADMMEQLRQYHWPGNVRELEGIMQRALISSSDPVLKLAEPLVSLSGKSLLFAGPGSISDLRLVEREHIVAVLEEASWKIAGDSGAAARLGIPPSTLRSKMKKLAIVRPP